MRMAAIYEVNLRIPNAGENCGSSFCCGAIRRGLSLIPSPPPKILEPSPRVSGQRDRESHASNCVCLMFRCCAFIAHRTPSQKSVARTCGRKSWQLTVAYNRLTALGFPGLALPDAADGSFDFPATPDADRVRGFAIVKNGAGHFFVLRRFLYRSLIFLLFFLPRN